MKKFLLIFIFLISLCFFQKAVFAQKQIQIVTTTSDLRSIAEFIGGDKVAVLSLSGGLQDPHFVDPKPSYMLKVRGADLFIRNGLELEAGWESLIIDGSRNPRIKAGSSGHLDASKGIEPLEIPETVDRSMGDIHPFGNPHYWLDPLNAGIIAANITGRLSELSPAQAAYFEQNLAEFNKKLDQKMAEWSGALAPLRGEKVITYHKIWAYFARRFGLEIAGSLEPKPGIPPSAGHLEKIIELVRNDKIRLILQENIYSNDAAEFVAGRAGARVIRAPISVGGTKEARDYFTLMDTIVQMLMKGYQND